MEAGQVRAHGATARLLNAPPTGFAAALAGLNRLEGTVTAIGAATVEVACGEITILATTEHAPVQPGQEVAVTFDPHAATIGTAPEACNQWAVRVLAIEATSLAAAQLRLDLGGYEATVPVDRESALGVAVGSTVSLAISKANVFVHPK
ncbi:TOBE domain-containing protein [Corynebacterium aurimucosum]|uniref:TOBE domain-containing protein n=1 Tax=Corynebacterium aurimucosum TaxID=169292 RepID=UPI0039C89E06